MGDIPDVPFKYEIKRQAIRMSFVKRYTNKVLRALFKRRDEARRERDSDG